MPWTDGEEYWTDNDGRWRRICNNSLFGALDTVENPARAPLLIHVSPMGVLALQVEGNIVTVDRERGRYTCSCNVMGKRCGDALRGERATCMCRHALVAAFLVDGYRPVSAEAQERLDNLADRLEALRDEMLPERRDARHPELWERADAELRAVRAWLRDSRIILNWLQARRQLHVPRFEPSERWERYEGEFDDGGLNVLCDEIIDRELKIRELESREARLVALRDGIRPGGGVEPDVLQEQQELITRELRETNGRIDAINSELKSGGGVAIDVVRAWDLARERLALVRYRDCLEEDAWYYDVALRTLEPGVPEGAVGPLLIRSAGGDLRYRRLALEDALLTRWECAPPEVDG